jgi:hypothetical protein
MMTHRLFASLVSLSIASACAPAQHVEPAKPAPVVPVAPTPVAKDDAILFGISPRPNGQYGAGFDGKAITVFENGDWVTSVMGRIGRGHLPADVLAQIRTELASATWKVAYDQLTCAAVPSFFIDYRVSGKLVYTQAMCNGAQLDAESAKVLDDVTKLVTAASAK